MYIVLCILPEGRKWYYDENGQCHLALEVNDETSPQDDQQILLSTSLDDEIDRDNPLLLSINELMTRFSFIYTNQLIFQHERDFRNLPLLNYEFITSDFDSFNIYSQLSTSSKLSLLPQTPSLKNITLKFIDEDIGYGLFSSIDIEQGYIIGEYTGVVSRNRNTPMNGLSDYSVFYPSNDGSFEIDAKEYGNITRFINHSSTPNVKFHTILEHHVPHVLCVSQIYCASAVSLT